MTRTAMTGTPQPTTGSIALLIGTRKGAFILRSDHPRRKWKLSSPILLGHIVHHLVLDPRDRRTMLLAASTGHLGPTIFRSTDGGKSWKESTAPPAFPRDRLCCLAELVIARLGLKINPGRRRLQVGKHRSSSLGIAAAGGDRQTPKPKAFDKAFEKVFHAQRIGVSRTRSPLVMIRMC